jgi:hypothetical protein
VRKFQRPAPSHINYHANREDQRFEDQARRAHLFTWHLMRQRDIATFNEKVRSFNADSDESQDDD